MAQPPLANDNNGIALKVPDNARYWRIQRMTERKGKQKTLYDNGRPLQIRIEDDADDLRRAVEAAGHSPAAGFKYRLEAVDEDGHSLGVVAFTDLCEPGGPCVSPRPDDDEGSNSDGSHGAGGVVVAAVSKLTALVEEMNRGERATRDELIRALRAEKEDNARTFRDIIKVQTEALSEVTRGLASNFTPISQVASYEDDEVEQSPSKPAEKIQTLTEQIGEALKMAPDAIQAIQAIKSIITSTQATSNGVVNGVHSTTSLLGGDSQ